MRHLASAGLLWLGAAGLAAAGPYAPAVGQPGSTAVADTDANFVGWANGFSELERGPQDISDPDVSSRPLATFGAGVSALGPANARSGGETSVNEGTVVSLGDGGRITLSFTAAITNGPGADFAVFENGFNDTFLELAFVEVCSIAGIYYRFPNTSLTQTLNQINQGPGDYTALDTTNIDGLAGKYRVGFGTPFDLSVLAGSPFLDLNAITSVRIIDVVGSIARGTDGALLYGTTDTSGRAINDPFTTEFFSGGFDLDAVGVLHQIPEPTTGGLALIGSVGLLGRRLRRKL